MRFTYEGKEYEFRGEYHTTEKGDWFLSNSGTVLLDSGTYKLGIRAIVHLLPRLHDFAGIRLEETGEVRCPKLNEFFIAAGVVFLCVRDHAQEARPILRPHSIVGVTSDA